MERMNSSALMSGIGVLVLRRFRFPFQVSMMVHRIENTLLIDEFDIRKHLLRTAETEWEWLKKFFYDHVLKSLSDKVRCEQE
jgi:hypothetical protein